MDRFEHRPFSQSIKDNLTGYLHSDLKDITDLLNEVSKCNEVMKKYGISSVEELDHILFYARVW